MKNPEVMAIKLKSGGWVLKITTYQTDDQAVYSTYMFKTLIATLQAACILKVHVDNNDELPIKQYLKIAA